MSSEIYYARAFIRVGEKYVPLVNQGSSNTWEFSLNGRDVPEKYWQVLTWRNRSRLMFSEAEIREIAKEYEQISQKNGDRLKSRNCRFETGEFERWILCGMKSAYTVEEYVSFGNSFELHDYSNDEYKDRKIYLFRTTSEFLSLIEELQGQPCLNVRLSNKREVYKPVKQRIRADYRSESEYYVLAKLDVITGHRYLCGFKSKRLIYSTVSDHKEVKTFKTENSASKYLGKYNNRLNGCFVTRITKETSA